MDERNQTLVLWDIDRTLLYVGDIDRQVYREAFAEVVGRPAERLPARGTGITMPLATRALLLENGVPEHELDQFLPRMVRLLPQRLATHTEELRRNGVLMPGAVEALRAVRQHPGCIPTVVTGNLQENASLKLSAFRLDDYLDTEVGGYASDDSHRPALVGVAQRRAGAKYGRAFTAANTVIIGDSLEDVRTGREGGARVVGVASGKTTKTSLAHAGADLVLETLEDVSQVLDSIATLTSRSRL